MNSDIIIDEEEKSRRCEEGGVLGPSSDGEDLLHLPRRFEVWNPDSGSMTNRKTCSVSLAACLRERHRFISCISLG